MRDQLLAPDTNSTLLRDTLCDDEVEEVISLRTMGVREPTVAEDPSPTMDVIFRDLNPDGHEISIVSPEAAEGEREELGLVATKEVITGEGHERDM